MGTEGTIKGGEQHMHQGRILVGEVQWSLWSSSRPPWKATA